MVSQNKYYSSLGVLIRWEELWKYLEHVLIVKMEHLLKICNAIRLQEDKFPFNHQKFENV